MLKENKEELLKIKMETLNRNNTSIPIIGIDDLLSGFKSDKRTYFHSHIQKGNRTKFFVEYLMRLSIYGIKDSYTVDCIMTENFIEIIECVNSIKLQNNDINYKDIVTISVNMNKVEIRHNNTIVHINNIININKTSDSIDYIFVQNLPKAVFYITKRSKILSKLNKDGREIIFSTGHTFDKSDDLNKCTDFVNMLLTDDNTICNKTTFHSMSKAHINYTLQYLNNSLNEFSCKYACMWNECIRKIDINKSNTIGDAVRAVLELIILDKDNSINSLGDNILNAAATIINDIDEVPSDIHNISIECKTTLCERSYIYKALYDQTDYDSILYISDMYKSTDEFVKALTEQFYTNEFKINNIDNFNVQIYSNISNNTVTIVPIFSDITDEIRNKLADMNRTYKYKITNIDSSNKNKYDVDCECIETVNVTRQLTRKRKSY